MGLWFARIAPALGLGVALGLSGAPAAHAAPVKDDKPAAAVGATKKKGAGARAKKKKAAQKPGKARGADEGKKDESKSVEAKKSGGKKKKKKAVAARSDASRRRDGKARKDRKDRKDPPKPCLGPVAQIDRGGLEAERIILVDCKGKPREEARKQLSVLARPWGAARPSAIPDAPPAGPKAPPLTRSQRAGEVAPSVRLVDPGLLVRVDALARRYPDRAISLVSGYRPQSRGSLHQTARALDLRIAGVPNHELVAACRTIPDTGCGYYPNSSFIHIDVRTPGTGTVSWIDASGPGEAPRYVTAWPPPAQQPEEVPAQKAAEKAGEAPVDKAAEAPVRDAAEKDAAAQEKGTGAAQRDARMPEREAPTLETEAEMPSSAVSPDGG